MKDVFLIAAIGLCVTAVPLLVWRAFMKRHGRLSELALNSAVLCCTVTLIVSGFALFWHVTAGEMPDDLQAVMPENLKRKDIAGSRDYYWLGHLHRFNSVGFRGGNFSKKDSGVFRIIALGDSLTFGQGVAETDTYPMVLQKMLREKYRVEVLNFGVCGNQISDIQKLFERFGRELKPDLVIYGFCLNDFLPSGVGQYQADQWSIPLPEGLKSWFINRISMCNYFARKYDEFLRKNHMRRDFFDDIIISLEQNSEMHREFLRNAQQMNVLSREVCGTDVVSAVLDQYPGDLRGGLVGDQAAAVMTKAGMHVIDHRPYFKGREQEQYYVSKWEGHPNEKCHRIFAQMFYDAIMLRCEVQLRAVALDAR
jgi:hypothetical protein